MGIRRYLVALVTAMGLTACGSGDAIPVSQSADPGVPTGTVSLAITDGPMEEAHALVLHVTYIEFGHANGDVTRLEPQGGPLGLDMMQLQNGTTHDLLARVNMPAGDYDWLHLGIDPDNSYIDLQSGAHHGLELHDSSGLRVHESFAVHASQHSEFVLDFDLRLGVQHHQMGGMMGEQYELHSALRLMRMEDTGDVTGTVDAALVDVNHAGCDPAIGGNWAYLFPGDATQPDDVAESDTDGIDGPMATDRVELDTGTGMYRYHFAFVPAATYRVAFTCTGEWDEAGDDDYPNDPDGRFGFHAFSGPVEVVAGQVREFHIGP
jgi:hypothetical protein